MAEPGQTLRLSDFSQQMGLRKQAFTEEVAGRILELFRISVVATVGLTFILAAIDATFIALDWIEPLQRLVTEKVLMAIIGASIVQVGAASIAIVYSLFRQNSSDLMKSDEASEED
jgi:hypothetical protein